MRRGQRARCAPTAADETGIIAKNRGVAPDACPALGVTRSNGRALATFAATSIGGVGPVARDGALIGDEGVAQAVVASMPPRAPSPATRRAVTRESACRLRSRARSRSGRARPPAARRAHRVRRRRCRTRAAAASTRCERVVERRRDLGAVGMQRGVAGHDDVLPLRERATERLPGPASHDDRVAGGQRAKALQVRRKAPGQRPCAPMTPLRATAAMIASAGCGMRRVGGRSWRGEAWRGRRDRGGRRGRNGAAKERPPGEGNAIMPRIIAIPPLSRVLPTLVPQVHPAGLPARQPAAALCAGGTRALARPPGDAKPRGSAAGRAGGALQPAAVRAGDHARATRAAAAHPRRPGAARGLRARAPGIPADASQLALLPLEQRSSPRSTVCASAKATLHNCWWRRALPAAITDARRRLRAARRARAGHAHRDQPAHAARDRAAAGNGGAGAREVDLPDAGDGRHRAGARDLLRRADRAPDPPARPGDPAHGHGGLHARDRGERTAGPALRRAAARMAAHAPARTRGAAEPLPAPRVA